MKTVVAALMLLCVCLISGCSIPGNFYLIQGPSLAGETPATFSASLKGLIHPEGLSAVLANGEGFQGKWVSVSSGKRRIQDASIPPDPKLAAAWDKVYGQGFFVAHIVGTRFFARTMLTGSKGTVLQVEIYRREHDSDSDRRDAGPIDIKGVAQDDKGNIYKVVF